MIRIGNASYQGTVAIPALVDTLDASEFDARELPLDVRFSPQQ